MAAAGEILQRDVLRRRAATTDEGHLRGESNDDDDKGESMKFWWSSEASAPLKCECGHNRGSHSSDGGCEVEVDERHQCACFDYYPVPAGTQTTTEKHFGSAE